MRIAMLMVMAGCAAIPYRPYEAAGLYSPAGGYSNSRKAPGVHLVRFDGNARNPDSQLVAYAVRRGAEVCQAEDEDFTHVLLSDPQDDATGRGAEHTYTTESSSVAYSYRGLTVGSGTANSSRNTYFIRDHVIRAYAVCVTEEEWQKRQETLRKSLLRGVVPDDGR